MLHLNCTALSQLELSNFLMYIISWVTLLCWELWRFVLALAKRTDLCFKGFIRSREVPIRRFTVREFSVPCNITITLVLKIQTINREEQRCYIRKENYTNLQRNVTRDSDLFSVGHNILVLFLFLMYSPVCQNYFANLNLNWNLKYY